MFPPSFYDHFEDWLNLAVFDINHQGLDMPTIAEQLKAARAELAKARTEAATAVSGSADAAKAVLVEVSKVKAETADLLAEIAELTNGGPPLDEPVGPTLIPPNQMDHA